MGQEEKNEYAQKKSDELKIPRDTYLRIVASSIEQTDGDLALLEKALNDDDRAIIKDSAHRIKGVYLNLRIETVSNPAKEIDQLVKDDASIEQMKEQFGNLKAAYAEMKDLLG